MSRKPRSLLPLPSFGRRRCCRGLRISATTAAGRAETTAAPTGRWMAVVTATTRHASNRRWRSPARWRRAPASASSRACPAARAGARRHRRRASTEGQPIATIDRARSTRRPTRPWPRSRSRTPGSRAPKRRWPTRSSSTIAQDLFDAGALPRQRLDGAETAHRAATAQRELAKANLAQAEATLAAPAKCSATPPSPRPLTGFVVERNYDAGRHSRRSAGGRGGRPAAVEARGRRVGARSRPAASRA